MILSGKPACCNEISIKVIDGFEVIIGRKVSIELNSEVVTGEKEKNSQDIGNVMLMEDVAHCDTIRNIMDGVFGIWEGDNGLFVLDDDGVIIVSGYDFTSRGKIGAEGVLGNRDMILVSSHIIDDSAGMEKPVGNINHNRADLVEGVAHEAHN